MSRNSQSRSDGAERPFLDPGALGDPKRAIVVSARDHDSDHRYPPHHHDRAQLVYASVGVMSVTTAEGTWVVPPQQAVWVPAGVVHEVVSKGPRSMRTLYFHPQALAGLPEHCCVLRISPLLREIILRLVSYDQSEPPGPEEARLLAIIPDELKAAKAEPLNLPQPQDRRLKTIAAGLTGNPADNRTLAIWARQAGASERTLARLFQAETGFTFGAWRQRLRLITAVARLAEGQAVTTVAFDLGYDSPSAFIAMFRRSLGASPGRYFDSLAGQGEGSAQRSGDTKRVGELSS